MSNQGDFLGRIRDNWQQRAGEKTTFRAELRVIPRWPVRLLLSLYFLALAVVAGVTLYMPEGVPHDLIGKPVAVKLLAMFGVVTGVVVVLSIVVLFYGYIWADAKRRGMSPVLWLLVSLLVPYLIGAILYFVVREPLPMDCPQCGRAINAHFNFCPGCQFNLRPNCPQCRRAVRAGDHFCASCGLTLQPDATGQVPAPTP
ncbi:MAG TPA: zinc ribbon domain-containing protein [Terriglobia bacterium]|nr:zinc ribbon domain-containing protein [Terriglobia bacterium]